MELKEYLLADCTLYRTPPVDFSKVNSQIEKILVESWRKGGSIDGAIDKLLSSQSINSEIAEQLEKSMTFQRKIYLDSIQEKQDLEKEKYREESKERIANINERYNRDISNTKTLIDETSAEYTKTRDDYSAAQSSLNATRARIKKRLAKVGGEERLSDLLEINAALMGDKSYGAAKDKVMHTVKVATSDKEIDPLNGNTIDDIVVDAEVKKPKHRGAIGRFFRRIFGGSDDYD